MAQFLGPTPEMPDALPALKPLFVLLVFSSDDRVVATSLIRARDLEAAHGIAEQVMLTRRTAAGYQLWFRGDKVLATFPTQHPPARGTMGAVTNGSQHP